jgi:hypothetical protein
MFKRVTEKEYYEIAKNFGIEFKGPYPNSIKEKTNWQCQCGNSFYRSYKHVTHKQRIHCLKCSSRKGERRIDEECFHKAGENFGCTYLGPFPKTIKGKTWWKCINKECNNTFYRDYYHVAQRGQLLCLKCQPSNGGKKGDTSPVWRGHEEISGKYINRLEKRAKARNLVYILSNEYLWNLFLQQNRKCKLSALELAFGKGQTASLDRIDSSKGYFEGNVQWVHKDINLMKNKFNEEYFTKMCGLIVDQL